MATGWVHYIVMDLFVGRWIFLEGWDKRVWTTHSLICACLPGLWVCSPICLRWQLYRRLARTGPVLLNLKKAQKCRKNPSSPAWLYSSFRCTGCKMSSVGSSSTSTLLPRSSPALRTRQHTGWFPSAFRCRCKQQPQNPLRSDPTVRLSGLGATARLREQCALCCCGRERLTTLALQAA
jgi:hypothetical protein